MAVIHPIQQDGYKAEVLLEQGPTGRWQSKLRIRKIEAEEVHPLCREDILVPNDYQDREHAIMEAYSHAHKLIDEMGSSAKK